MREGKGERGKWEFRRRRSRLRKIGHRCIRKRPGTLPGQTVQLFSTLFVVVEHLCGNFWLFKAGTSHMYIST